MRQPWNEDVVAGREEVFADGRELRGRIAEAMHQHEYSWRLRAVRQQDRAPAACHHAVISRLALCDKSDGRIVREPWGSGTGVVLGCAQPSVATATPMPVPSLTRLTGSNLPQRFSTRRHEAPVMRGRRAARVDPTEALRSD